MSADSMNRNFTNISFDGVDSERIWERVYRDLCDATSEFVQAAGFEDVVIGLSGGIDSSLVCAIVVDALGPAHVYGVMLPGPYSSKESIVDAETLSQSMGIKSLTISITEPYEMFTHEIAKATNEALTGLAAENTQARCRMVCIMALSNAKGWLMLNTGNRSEAAMGYSTLYGDTAGAFSPIGGLLKTQVYMLAKWLNRHDEKTIGYARIPSNVLTKAPSAELSHNQSDEASMGIDYSTLDGILSLYLDFGLNVQEIEARGFDKQKITMVLNRYASYSYKRASEPPYPALDFLQGAGVKLKRGEEICK